MPPGPVLDGEPLGCIKVAYDSAEGAQSVAAAFGHKVYLCPKCGKWHVTKHARFMRGDIGRRGR